MNFFYMQTNNANNKCEIASRSLKDNMEILYLKLNKDVNILKYVTSQLS